VSTDTERENFVLATWKTCRCGARLRQKVYATSRVITIMTASCLHGCNALRNRPDEQKQSADARDWEVR